MDEVRVKVEQPQRYVSRSCQLGADAIDAFVRETIAELRRENPAAGAPFTCYHGCSKDDEQIVQVCLPTEAGDQETPLQEVAFTIARGEECDYPQILSAYDAVVAYATANDREFDGPPRETYLPDPGSGKPEMQVAFPLKIGSSAKELQRVHRARSLA